MCENRNKFCYVCGLFTDGKHQRIFACNSKVVQTYNKLFNRSYQSSSWYEPEILCISCRIALQKPDKFKLFSKPMIWHYQTYHKPNDCYFCQTDLVGHSFKTRNNILYANVSTVTFPNFEVDNCIKNEITINEPDLNIDENVLDEKQFVPNKYRSSERHLVAKADFEDLIRDLNLTSRQQELLGSRLKQWNLVENDFVITTCRKPDLELKECFKSDNDNTNFVYCNNVPQLFRGLHHNYNSNEWRLFIDGSTKSKFKFLTL